MIRSGNNANSVCRLIVDPPEAGASNMAVDEALLADAIDPGVATLRLYQWSEPTLSLGYFQRYDDRHQHAASRNAAVVRRQSGGGAILHDRELTYSLALPASHPLASHAEQLYTAMHEAVIAVLAPLIAVEATVWRLQLRGCDECASSMDDEPFLCFQRRAGGDLLLVATKPPSTDSNNLGSGKAVSSGWKILGSAQRRRQGAILQHGSLLLETSPAAPELPGVNNLTGTNLTADDVAAALPDSMAAALQMRLQESCLQEDLRLLAAELKSRKYAAPTWTNRR